MRAATKRYLWTLAVGTVPLWGAYSCAKFSQTPKVLTGIWLGAVAVAVVIVHVGRRIPTEVRQEWNLGRGRAFAIAIMHLAVVLVALACAVAWFIPQIPIVVIYGLDNAGMGLMFGAMLGCGGVLGIAEDKPRNVAMNDATSDQ